MALGSGGEDGVGWRPNSCPQRFINAEVQSAAWLQLDAGPEALVVKMSRGEQLQPDYMDGKTGSEKEQLDVKVNFYTNLLGLNVSPFSGLCVYLLLIVWIKPSAVFGTSPTITKSHICGGKAWLSCLLGINHICPPSFTAEPECK